MHSFSLAILPGDGIGPDVTREALRVLEAVQTSLSGIRISTQEFACGAGEFLRHGDPLPAETLEACRNADAILLGAMGLPDVRWPDGREMAPQLDLREDMELYAGVRPIRLYHPAHSPLKADRSAGIDFILVRENTEGLFATRKRQRAAGAAEVRDELLVTRRGAERLFRASFRLAGGRRKKLALVDKANVLPSMAFLREIFFEVAREFPDIEASTVYVDAMALYMVQCPQRFDVLVTENMFGDILSDLAAGIVGGMGMAPSGDIGDKHAVFQPSHGSAPDIAGKGIANPIATILSLAMLLDWLPSDATKHGAQLIYSAVERCCQDPARATPDLGGKWTTQQIGEWVAGNL
jgi:3-isopropylmalate dehydrogenase